MSVVPYVLSAINCTAIWYWNLHCDFVLCQSDGVNISSCRTHLS